MHMHKYTYMYDRRGVSSYSAETKSWLAESRDHVCANMCSRVCSYVLTCVLTCAHMCVRKMYVS